MKATRAYCVSKRKATITLKCDPELALRLREEYPETIIPGYHMNKKHWNTVYIHKDVEQVQINKMIDWSYDLVLQSFSKRKQQELLD